MAKLGWLNQMQEHTRITTSELSSHVLKRWQLMLCVFVASWIFWFWPFYHLCEVNLVAFVAFLCCFFSFSSYFFWLFHINSHFVVFTHEIWMRTIIWARAHSQTTTNAHNKNQPGEKKEQHTEKKYLLILCVPLLLTKFFVCLFRFCRMPLFWHVC